MSTILITGAGGFFGSSLVEYFIKKTDHKIIGVVKNNTGYLSDGVLENKRLKLHFNILVGDLEQYLNDGDNNNYIIHLASQQPNKTDLSYQDYYHGNVETTLQLINLIKHKNVKAIVYISSINVLGQQLIKKIVSEDIIPLPINNYGLTKYLAERLLDIELRSSDSKRIIIRYPSLVGKNHIGGIVYTYYKLIKESKNLEIYSLGKQFRNIMHVMDAINVVYKVINNIEKFENYEIIHAGSSDSISTREIADIIKMKLNSNSAISLIDKKLEYSWDLFIDIAKLKNKLDFEPLSAADAIMNYLEEMK